MYRHCTIFKAYVVVAPPLQTNHKKPAGWVKTTLVRAGWTSTRWSRCIPSWAASSSSSASLSSTSTSRTRVPSDGPRVTTSVIRRLARPCSCVKRGRPPAWAPGRVSREISLLLTRNENKKKRKTLAFSKNKRKEAHLSENRLNQAKTKKLCKCAWF